MASKINATNINGNYPVAGQDNNSQGFRDNFTGIRNNFSAAADEITDLQNKAVLKRALVDGELSNDFAGAVVENAELRGTRETLVSLGTISGTADIDYASGSFFVLATSGNVTLEFSNPTPAETITTFKIQIVVTNVSHIITLPTAVTIGTDNIRGYDTNTIEFDQTGTYEFEFRTGDNGDNYSIQDLTRTLTLINQINDVVIDNAQNNEVLAYNAANDTWINLPISENVPDIADLGDVTLTTLQNNDQLIYDSSLARWVNASAESIAPDFSELGEINLANLQNNDQLVYDSDSEKWINVSPENIGYPTRNIFVTVADDGSTIQEVFVFDGSAIKNSSGDTNPIVFREGYKYRFDLSDASNETAPLRFSTTPDTTVDPNNTGSITPYTNNVTQSVADAGSTGAFIEIIITENTPQPLYFYAEEMDPAIDTSKIGGEVPNPVKKTGTTFSGVQEIDSTNTLINVDLSHSIITSDANIAAILPNGDEGATKIINYSNSSAGNTLITVSNAAWQGNSTISLSDTGDGCTLQYINGSWFCIGNNGATFA